MNPRNLAELVVRAAQRFGPRTAFVVGDHSISYAGLDEAASRVAAWLQTRGIGKGSHIAILSENRLERIYADHPILGIYARWALERMK